MIPNGDTAPSSRKGTAFGEVSLSGQIGESLFSLFNNGFTDVTVLSISGSGDFQVIIPLFEDLEIGPGQSLLFGVRFTPTTVGSQDAVIEIVTEERLFNTRYTFQVTGKGLLRVLNTNNSGPGSFRELLLLSEEEGGTEIAPVITFDPSLAGQTIALSPPSIRFHSEVTVDASDLAEPVVFNGQDAMRIFIFDNARSFFDRIELIGVVIRDGRTTSSFDGAALVNNGYLVLTDCEILSNRTRDSGDGGAIVNNGELFIGYCLLTGNTSGRDGGAIVNSAGAIVRITSSIISENSAERDGGAILNRGALRILKSTLFGNRAEQRGGALAMFSASTEISRIRTSTLTDNQAWRGAAVYNEESFLELSSTTIVGNVASDPASAGIDFVVFVDRSPFENPEITVRNSIVAKNAPVDFAVAGFVGINPEAANLIGVNANVFTRFPVGPLVGVITNPLDPELEDLAVVREDYPPVMMPRSISPALHEAIGVTTPDQLDRFGRGPGRDLGAAERQESALPSLRAEWLAESGIVRISWEMPDWGWTLRSTRSGNTGTGELISEGLIQENGSLRFYDFFPLGRRTFFDFAETNVLLEQSSP